MEQLVFAGTSIEPDQIELDNRALSRRAAAEGFVLLENDGVLPLISRRIALYGSGARMTVKGGTGSGAVRERHSVSIEEGLRNAGLEITTSAWLDRFDAYYQNLYQEFCDRVEWEVAGVRDFYQILRKVKEVGFQYPTGVPVTDEDIEADRAAGVTTALFVIARQAGEGVDRKDLEGDYELDAMERQNLQTLSRSYENLVVIVNCGGFIDLSFVEKVHVSALVYFSQGGEEGGNALADVLTGMENFTGKLASSIARTYRDLPSADSYSYESDDLYHQPYREGIYLGYRYFDSFAVSPRYPFGYGLSYTSFSSRCTGVRKEGDGILVEARVRNEGKIPGCEVLQLYASVPYGTEGAEYKRLVAFCRTPHLAAGEEAFLTLRFSIRSLTKYDTQAARYYLDEGSYVLWLGNSAANVTAAALLTAKEFIVTEQCTNICGGGLEVDEIMPPERKDWDALIEDLAGRVPVIPVTAEDCPLITHTYDAVTPSRDPELDAVVRSLTNAELSELVCGGGTDGGENLVLAMGASGTTTSGLYETRGIPNVILSDGPQGLNLTPRIVQLPDGSWKAAKVEENLKAYARYMFGAAKMMVTYKMAAPEDGTEHYQYCTAWPCSQLLAQSFDTELLKKIGDGTAKEMEKYGVTVWLAPGMNLQRNPLCGRAFEYYSEDPVLSGTLAAALIRGVQRHPGKGVSIKHFVANNCELNRNESSSDLSERALRELYLKGFEIAVKEAAPMTVMASYNKVNGLHVVNNADLLMKVLRNEWGFDGCVISDWDSMKGSREDPSVPATGDVLLAHAAGLDLIMPGRKDQIQVLTDALEKGTIDRADLMRAAVRILKLISRNTVVDLRAQAE